VRHAEKAAEPKDDPPLSPAGRERVRALLDLLRDTRLDVIYSTPKLRNLETARPVADSLHVRIVQVPIESGKIDAYARDIARRVRKEGGGRISLVVGHSNTFGPVIKELGGPRIEEIADERYDDVFVLTVQNGRPARIIRAKFGKRWVP
jgi:broad specificity phosphatase PhoE